MEHMVGNFKKSSFTCNKCDIFWTYEVEVMINLVETTHVVWWLRENCRRLHKYSTKMTFHMLLLVLIFTHPKGMFRVYILMYSTIWKKVDWRIFRTASWHLLHHSMWVHGGILIHSLCCIFFLRLYMRPLHQFPIGAPDWFYVVLVDSLRVWF
jgi:hypothetical protein